MDKQEKQDILAMIECDGFEYAIIDGWTQYGVEDKKANQLRENYLTARRELTEYIGFKE